MYKSENYSYRAKVWVMSVSKALFENTTWGSCWLFAQSSTNRKCSLTERYHSRYSPFHELPQGHAQQEPGKNMGQQQMWCPELYWRRCRDHIPHANCSWDVTLGISLRPLYGMNGWRKWWILKNCFFLQLFHFNTFTSYNLWTNIYKL